MNNNPSFQTETERLEFAKKAARRRVKDANLSPRTLEAVGEENLVEDLTGEILQSLPLSPEGMTL